MKYNFVALMKVPIGLLYSLYLLFDIVHFFRFRLDRIPPEGVFYHASFESLSVSIIKWSICSIAIFAFSLGIRHTRIFHFCISTVAILGVLLFFSHGKFQIVVRGSIATTLAIFELASICGLLYFHNQTELSSTYKWMNYLLAILASVLFVIFLHYNNIYI